ncbi:MAG: GNAT family N-acetyltransferase [Coprobacillus sp.]
MIKENTPRIETERLILRKFNDDDIEDMFLIYSDETVNEFLPWFPFKNQQEAREYLYHNIYEDYKKPIGYRYAVEYKETGHVIGYVSIHGIDEEKKNGFLSVSATHDQKNPKSGRVMEKLGMTYRYCYDEMWQLKNIKVVFNYYQIDF